MIGVFFCLLSWISAFFLIIIDKREEEREEKCRGWGEVVLVDGGGEEERKSDNREGSGGGRRKLSFQEKIKLVPNSPKLQGSLAEKYEVIKDISQRSINLLS